MDYTELILGSKCEYKNGNLGTGQSPDPELTFTFLPRMFLRSFVPSFVRSFVPLIPSFFSLFLTLTFINLEDNSIKMKTCGDFYDTMMEQRFAVMYEELNSICKKYAKSK